MATNNKITVKGIKVNKIICMFTKSGSLLSENGDNVSI